LVCCIKFKTEKYIVALENHFESFVKERISEERYKKVSEVIRAGLRLLEQEEYKFHYHINPLNQILENGCHYQRCQADFTLTCVNH